MMVVVGGGGGVGVGFVGVCFVGVLDLVWFWGVWGVGFLLLLLF